MKLPEFLNRWPLPAKDPDEEPHEKWARRGQSENENEDDTESDSG